MSNNPDVQSTFFDCVRSGNIYELKRMLEDDEEHKIDIDAVNDFFQKAQELYGNNVEMGKASEYSVSAASMSKKPFSYVCLQNKVMMIISLWVSFYCLLFHTD